VSIATLIRAVEKILCRKLFRVGGDAWPFEAPPTTTVAVAEQWQGTFPRRFPTTHVIARLLSFGL
jgi:hypothetical protein